MASQIFEAFIKFRFFGRIHDSLVVKALTNAASIFNFETGLIKVMWPAGAGTGTGAAASASTGGGRYRKKQHGGENKQYANDMYDASLVMFLNIFTENT